MSYPLYTPPGILFNRHVETIYPSLLRRVKFRQPRRERISTPDDDFLDLDWYEQKSENCVIISHGLEGDSQRPYAVGMARAFFSVGMDALAWNYRGCSGEVNRQLRFYHSGATDDLQTVIEHVAKRYKKIYLIGFSLGGNITLKYLGENHVHPGVKKAVAFSVPVNLHTSCLSISQPSNSIYANRFLRKLKEKVAQKAATRKDLRVEGLNSVRTLIEFDDLFTAPIHGFRDAIDYYTRCSSIGFISNINIPTLLISAKNDPFLAPDCYPAGHAFLKTHYPEHGGHVGFALFQANGLYWSEMMALSFIQES